MRFLVLLLLLLWGLPGFAQLPTSLAEAQTRALAVDPQLAAIKSQDQAISQQQQILQAQIDLLEAARYNQISLSLKGQSTVLLDAPDAFTTTTGRTVFQSSYKPGPGWPTFTMTATPGSTDTNPYTTFGFSWNLNDVDPTRAQSDLLAGQILQLEQSRAGIAGAVAQRTEQIKFQTLGYWQEWKLAQARMQVQQQDREGSAQSAQAVTVLYRFGEASIDQLRSSQERTRADALSLVEAQAAENTARAKLFIFLQLPL